MTTTRAGAVHSGRRILIEAPPAQVWAALEQVDRYQAWWPWLRSFDARTLSAGDTWSCTVQPPLPYRVRFTIELGAVSHRRPVQATVAGDVAGAARIDLEPHPAGTVLALSADLHAASRWLRLVERWAPPVARFGHDRIIDRAMSELAARVSSDD